MPRYQVSLVAEHLKYGWFRKPNCFAIVERDGSEIGGLGNGRTEIKKADEDPDWIKVFFIEADPACIVNLTVKVYHEKTYLGDKEYRDHVLLGTATFEATEVNRATDKMLAQKLENGGKISISVVECNPEIRGRVKIQLRGLDIKNVEPGILGLGRSDPFFEISKQSAIHSLRYVTVYRSKVIEQHLNPFWEEVVDLSLEELCDGNLDGRLRISVFDACKRSKRMIGFFETTLKTLQENISVKGNADRDRAFELGLEDKFDVFGFICVLQCDVSLD